MGPRPVAATDRGDRRVVRQGPASTPCSSSRSARCTSCSRRWWPPAPASARRCRPTQQKMMQYLPVVFAVFLVFYLTGLVDLLHGPGDLPHRAAVLHHQALLQGRAVARSAGAGAPASAAREIEQERGRRRRHVRPGQARHGRGEGRQRQGAPAARRAASAGGRPASSTVSKRVTPPKNKPHRLDRVGRHRPADRAGPRHRPAARTARAAEEEVRKLTMEWVETTGRSIDEAKEQGARPTRRRRGRRRVRRARRAAGRSVRATSRRGAGPGSGSPDAAAAQARPARSQEARRRSRRQRGHEDG